MATAVIEVENFQYRIGEKEILKSVTFAVEEGEFVSVIGPNGAGKSTLVKCLNRVLTGGRGTIEIRGKALESYSQKELARQIGYVPQTNAPLFSFSVEEFVLMGRYPHLSPFSTIRARDWEVVTRALEITGSIPFRKRHLNTLSGGERQKIAIAAALAQETTVLLLDEPTTFLDPKHQGEIHHTLRKLNQEEGITILSVTHDINHAARVSDRVIALKEGRVTFQGPPGELMKNETLQPLYDREFLFAPHPHGGTPMIAP